jgi:hypothetical protein
MDRHVVGFAISGLLGLFLAAGCSSSSKTDCKDVPIAACAGGAKYQYCVTSDSSGNCTAGYYTVGSQTFNCVSCTDLTKCVSDATSACLGSGAGDAGTD